MILGMGARPLGRPASPGGRHVGRSYFHLHLVSDATGETLIAVSRSDDPTDHDTLRAAMARIPAGTKRFVSADGGHGYALVWGVQAGVMAPTPFADTVADWVRGRYAS